MRATLHIVSTQQRKAHEQLHACKHQPPTCHSRHSDCALCRLPVYALRWPELGRWIRCLLLALVALNPLIAEAERDDGPQRARSPHQGRDSRLASKWAVRYPCAMRGPEAICRSCVLRRHGEWAWGSMCEALTGGRHHIRSQRPGAREFTCMCRWAASTSTSTPACTPMPLACRSPLCKANSACSLLPCLLPGTWACAWLPSQMPLQTPASLRQAGGQILDCIGRGRSSLHLVPCACTATPGPAPFS